MPRWGVALCVLGLGGAAGPAAHAAEAPAGPPPQTHPAQAPAPDGRVEVWVDLSLPPIASLPRDGSEPTAEWSDRITRQQDEVMAALRPLGAVEQARVRIVRNALAVRLPASSIPAARRLPGVRGVHAVRHLHTNGN